MVAVRLRLMMRTVLPLARSRKQVNSKMYAWYSKSVKA